MIGLKVEVRHWKRLSCLFIRKELLLWRRSVEICLSKPNVIDLAVHADGGVASCVMPVLATLFI